MRENLAFDFRALPLRSADYAATLGPTVVIAPTPTTNRWGVVALLP
ncbi:hypothetical protein [Hymenobacter volaticus]|uniref:Uncharacterized protein n=1 Tax=Hymenobacter volaticus TaxID=2932254 RepID=A0ABY4G7K3_9BACT|nr:hypothetical protein [Hymenobacter volaticus]UOQ66853.1 hypothetical protein MUN86_02750 [Hymenobacter volaticus]